MNESFRVWVQQLHIYNTYHDGLRWVGPADVHQDLIVLAEVDPRLIVGEDGLLVLREGGGNIRDSGF